MASHTKPIPPAYLKPGKAVGAVKGFASTFNWLVDWVSNLRFGEGIYFEQRPDSAHPVIRGNKIVAGEGVTVEDDGGGTVTISSTGGGELTFSSASDSNVQITQSGGAVTIGVYWL